LIQPQRLARWRSATIPPRNVSQTNNQRESSFDIEMPELKA